MKRRTTPAKTSRVVAYIRVSTDKQASDGNSLEAQRARIEAYALAMQLEVVAYEVDAGASAKSLDRPALQRALARLDAFEADTLLVVKLDRLTRNVRDLCDLVDTYFREGQYHLASVGEHIDTRSAAGRMLLNVLTAIGQWEREAIGERTAAVMQHMKAQGEYTGGQAPYGFRIVEGRLEPEPLEACIVERARALRASGLSLRGIARELGPNNRTGRAFDPKQIARMM